MDKHYPEVASFVIFFLVLSCVENIILIFIENSRDVRSLTIHASM